MENVPEKIQLELDRKAAALIAEKSWEPSKTDLQRGHVQMLKDFNLLQNLPVEKFADMANRSLQRIYSDIAAKCLLALDAGTGEQRIPDWQLDQTCLALTQQILAKATNVDEWTLYYALSEPMESLDGKAPIQAVQKTNINIVASATLNFLGIHD